MAMKSIYFVRHCSAEGQHRDSPLTRAGIRQTKDLAAFFLQQNIQVDYILSSPYLRAVETIKPFASLLGKKIDIDERLKERVLSAEPLEDWWEALKLTFADSSYALPGGESGDQALQRAEDALKEIYTNPLIKNAIVVSHGNLLSILFRQFDAEFGFDQWREMGNPDVFLLQVDEKGTRFQRIWDDSLTNRNKDVTLS